MTFGYGSVGVNDQLVPIPVKAAYKPLAFGPTYTGPAMWPRQGVYNVPPVYPSPDLQMSLPPQSYGGNQQQVGTNSMIPSALSSEGSPWSLRASPLWWALGALVIGLAGLHFIHFR